MGASILHSLPQSLDVFSWIGHLVVVWIIGVFLGWLLPRPKWAKRKPEFLLSAPGVWLRRVSVTWNIFLIVREVWYRFCQPGTFRAILRALWISLTTRQPFQWPESLRRKGSAHLHPSGGASSALADSLRWYVTTADLQTFRDAVEAEDGPAWEKMLHKQWDGCTYTAWRRTLPTGKTEYKSMTLSEDATAQEFMDFYLDDDVRPKWDGMISEHQLLESAHAPAHRCQVVRWLRSFPFAFISRREYVIARRLFPGDDPNTLYGITKSIEHPAAPPMPGVVRMSSFYSMWRSRTVPDPQGSDKPMCETTLLHFEDFGIPEHLARFAVRHGMAGFVSKMVPYVKEFVAERRTRVGPYQPDAKAYGAGLTPVMAAGMVRSSVEGGGLSLSEPPSPSSPKPPSQSGTSMLRSSSVRGFGYMLLASGVALALSRTGSAPALRTGASRHASDDEDGEDDADKKGGSAAHRRSMSLVHHRIRRNHGGGGYHHGHHHLRTHGAIVKHHHHHHSHHHNHATNAHHRSSAVGGSLQSHRVAHADGDA